MKNIGEKIHVFKLVSKHLSLMPVIQTNTQTYHRHHLVEIHKIFLACIACWRDRQFALSVCLIVADSFWKEIKKKSSTTCYTENSSIIWSICGSINLALHSCNWLALCFILLQAISNMKKQHVQNFLSNLTIQNFHRLSLDVCYRFHFLWFLIIWICHMLFLDVCCRFNFFFIPHRPKLSQVPFDDEDHIYIIQRTKLY